jgi:plasmid maintenance system killer protein
MKKIEIRDKKLRAAIQDDRLRQRLYGKDMAQKIKLRMNSLVAAESLADFWPPKSGPERCHELTGEEAGSFSVDLKHPYRLIFIPTNMPACAGNLDQRNRWQFITEIEVLGIEDTHG